MKLVWLSWKDNSHPQAGGAELVKEALAAQLVAHGHKVKLIVGGYPNAKPIDKTKGYEIIRVGNRFSVYRAAKRYYQQNHLEDWADLVIDEVNTMPFFAKFYAHNPTILMVHMLCREIWWQQIGFPLNLIGHLAEPIYLRLLSSQSVITVSASTQADLMRYGFKRDRIAIIPEIIQLKPLTSIKQLKKYPQPTILALGSIRPMKRTLDVVKAYELAKPQLKDLKLIIAGDTTGSYGAKVLAATKTSRYKSDIKVLGTVSEAKKAELMQQSHLIAVTSLKEGWGLIVSEAASQGTPAVVYNVDGLRDSVYSGEAGWLAPANTPAALAETVTQALKNTQKYDTIRRIAWQHSQKLTARNSYQAFIKVLQGSL